MLIHHRTKEKIDMASNKSGLNERWQVNENDIYKNEKVHKVY